MIGPRRLLRRIRRSKIVPTDLEITELIYELYYDEFERYAQDEPSRDAKIYVPISIDRIASRLGVDGDMVFGRLYYDMEHRYGYEHPDGTLVHFFANRLVDDIHCVNFPFLASIVANLQDRQRKHHIATVISILSLLIAGVPLWVSLGP